MTLIYYSDRTVLPFGELQRASINSLLNDKKRLFVVDLSGIHNITATQTHPYILTPITTVSGITISEIRKKPDAFVGLLQNRRTL